MLATWSIDRSLLSLSPLVVGTSGTATTIRVLDGLVMPGRARSHAWAYDSGISDGVPSMGSTVLNSAWVLPVKIDAASASALVVAVDEFVAAVDQHTFVMTATIGGVGKTWTCYAAESVVTSSRYGALAQNFDLVTATIPCNPIPGVAA